MKFRIFSVPLVGCLVGGAQAYAAVESTLTLDMSADVTNPSGVLTHYGHLLAFEEGPEPFVWAETYDLSRQLRISNQNPDPDTGTRSSFSMHSGASVTAQAYANLPPALNGYAHASAAIRDVYPQAFLLAPGGMADFKVDYSYASAVSTPTPEHVGYRSFFGLEATFLTWQDPSDPQGAGLPDVQKFIGYMSIDAPIHSETGAFEWSFQNTTDDNLLVGGRFSYSDYVIAATVPELPQGDMMLLGLGALGVAVTGRRVREGVLPA